MNALRAAALLGRSAVLGAARQPAPTLPAFTPLVLSTPRVCFSSDSSNGRRVQATRDPTFVATGDDTSLLADDTAASASAPAASRLASSAGSDADADEPEIELGPLPYNPETGEIDGPRGPEPTRYGDYAFKGRCSDF